MNELQMIHWRRWEGDTDEKLCSECCATSTYEQASEPVSKFTHVHCDECGRAMYCDGAPIGPLAVDDEVLRIALADTTIP